jgi:hypothetical protein
VNERFPPKTAGQRRIAARREAVRLLTNEGHSARKIAAILGVSPDTAARDVRYLTWAEVKREPLPHEPWVSGSVSESAPSRLAESAGQACASIVTVIPACEARDLMEFYERASNLAATTRRLGDNAAAELWDDLSRRLASEAQRRAAPVREGEPAAAR